MEKIRPCNRERVLILAPIGRDAKLAQEVLEKETLTALACEDIRAVCSGLLEGAGVLLIAEEALNADSVEALKEKLADQAPWSDIPIILLTTRGDEKKTLGLIRAFGAAANIHLLERPFHPVTLVSAVHMAMRARRRQYQVYELLAKVNESQDRYALAVKGSNVGVWEWDLEKDALYLSPEWKALFGGTDVPLNFRHCLRRFHPGDRARVFDFMRNAGRGGPDEKEKNYELEYRLRDNCGAYRHILSRGTVFFGSGARARRVTGSHIDITDRKRSEEKLIRLTDQLNASNHELETFAYAASHDLQEPLRIISIYLDLFVDSSGGQLGKESLYYLEHARESSLRLQKFIQDLLQYARVGSKAGKQEKVALERAAKAALSNLKLAVMESGAEVTLERLPVVLADLGAMSQLFQNLIGNALKYKADRPLKIHISCEKADRSWRIGIRDNGIGIAPEHREKVFDIFQRLQTEKESKGTGLGLALCRKIVEKHGGRIWVDSTPGEGSSFYFTLPEA